MVYSSVVNMDAWFGHPICWTGILKTMLHFSFFFPFMSLSRFTTLAIKSVWRSLAREKVIVSFRLRWLVGWLVGWLFKWQINNYGSLMPKWLILFSGMTTSRNIQCRIPNILHATLWLQLQMFCTQFYTFRTNIFFFFYIYSL